MKIIPKKQQGGNIWDKNLIKNMQSEMWKQQLNNLTEEQKNEIKAWNTENSSFTDSSIKLDNLMKNFADKYSKTPYIPLSYNEKQVAPIIDDNITKAQQAGLTVNNIDELKAWQTQHYLEPTGTFDENTSKKANWVAHMDKLGYTKKFTKNGIVVYTDNNGTVYFDNGRMSQTGQMSNYDYTQLGQNTKSYTAPVSKTQPVITQRKFDSDRFKSEFAKNLESSTFGYKTYYRYDPEGHGDFYIDLSTGDIYDVKTGGGLGNKVDKTTVTKPYTKYYSNYHSLVNQLSSYYKQGGKMNKIKYFQQGGAAPQQQDLQQQVIALVQAAMQGDQQATQQVNQIMEAAKTGDPQATQIAQMIQQVVQQMQGQATSAKWGAKLRYIQSLKYAKGGKTCPECEKKKAEEKIAEKKCGGKAKKRYFGGIL